MLTILNKNIDNHLCFAMPLCEIGGLFKVPPLATHGNGGIEIKLEISRRLDKLFQFVNVLKLGIAVEEQGRVVGRGLATLMQLLQVLNQVVNSLGIEELRKSS